MNINLTMVSQAIAFAIFIWFVVRFVWPPLMLAIETRQKTIAEGLAAADLARSELSAANKRVEDELARTRVEATARLADAERRAQAVIEEAKGRATEEANRIIAAAQAEAGQQMVKAREALREQVAVLAVKGTEQILRKEVNMAVHADLLNRLKAEL